MGQPRPGLDFDPAGSKNGEIQSFDKMKKRKTRGSAKKSREKATLELNLSQRSVSINIQEQPIFGEGVMAGNADYLKDYKTMIEELFGYTSGPNKVLKLMINEMRQNNMAK